MIRNEEKEKEKDDLSEKMKKMFSGSEVAEKIMARREIFLWGAVDDDSAQAVVQKLLHYDADNSNDITLYINSPGGVISAGLAVLDCMNYISSDVRTVCMGWAASMGAVLLTGGVKGKRFAWPNSRILIHQPLISGNFFGPASDIEIQAEEMMRTRQTLNKILADATGKSLVKIEEDTDRDHFLSAQESIEYGLIDGIITKKP